MKKARLLFLCAVLCQFTCFKSVGATTISSDTAVLITNDGKCHGCKAPILCASPPPECNIGNCITESVGTIIDGYTCTGSDWETCTPNGTCYCSQSYSMAGCTQPANGVSQRYQSCSGTDNCGGACTKSAGSCVITCNSGYYKSGSSCAQCAAPSGWTLENNGALAVSTHIKTNNSGVNGQSDCYIDAGKYKDSTGNFDISPSCNW